MKKGIVFIHGNLLDSECFPKALFSREFPTFRQVYVEMPGHGNSKSIDDYSIAQLKREMIYELNGVDLDSFVILAHSYSGHLILQLINEWIGKSKVEALILVGTPPIQNPLLMSNYFNLENFINRDLIGEELYTAINNLKPLSSDYIQKCIRQTDQKFRYEMVKPDYYLNYKDECEEIKRSDVPMCLIYGEQDPFLNFEYVRALKQLDFCQVVILKDAGHLPFLDKSNEFIVVMKTCLNDVIFKHFVSISLMF